MRGSGSSQFKKKNTRLGLLSVFLCQVMLGSKRTKGLMVWLVQPLPWVLSKIRAGIVNALKYVDETAYFIYLCETTIMFSMKNIGVNAGKYLWPES